ncbi:ATP-binding protein [Streptomyces sp. H27-H5]|uniref:ATP-binding protein n=1 Tax=Streptomyces sp. H27-H5 TaxID=2996460 RepID=UPI00226E5FA3|nr:ATP-binding protein [Streptomyces sp. H27-H5]MCY0962720.1 ATP-binding protein [Streptomyces sp. H27-H5]
MDLTSGSASTGGTGAEPAGDAVLPDVVTSAAARRRVSDLLRGAGISLDSVPAADALLVTSELTANALRHGGGIHGFRTHIDGGALYLSVSDTSLDLPVSRAPAPDRPGGFGWPLIQRLADHVTIDTFPGGKTITTILRLIP